MRGTYSNKQKKTYKTDSNGHQQNVENIEGPSELEKLLRRNESAPPKPRIKGECYPSTSKVMFSKSQTASPQRSLSKAEGSGVSRTVRVSVKVEPVEEPELAPDGPRASHEPKRGNSYFTHFGHNTWEHIYATMNLPSIGVCVKQEPESNESADVIKEELADVIKEELADVVKEEGGEGDEAAEASGSAGVLGSEAAMLAALYADHVVKDELVLGPEVPHRPHITEIHDARGVSGGASREPRGGQLALKDCSMTLERCDAPRGAATREPAPESRAPGHGTAPHIRTDLNAANTYVCDMCGKICKRKHDIICHVNGHLRENSEVLPNKSNIYERVRASVKPYACDMRNKEFSTLGSLRRNTASDTFECDICGKVMNRKDNLINHVNLHLRDNSEVLSNKSDIYERVRASVKPYACDICNKEFSTLANLRRHQRDHHVPNTYVCDIYGKVIKRKDNLLSHVNCEICNKKLSGLQSLQRHRRVHTGERPYSCEICQKKFTESGTLKAHKRIHTGERPYSCDICNKKLPGLNSLQRHRRVHTGERPYSCEICQKKFTESGTLKAHKRIHTGERPYSCDICNKKLSGLHNLRRHRRVHTGERPYSCEICQKKFPESGTLKAHKRIHTGERPYSCDICKKKFAYSSSLKQHKMTHTGEKRIRKWYSCEICQKTFSDLRLLKSHKVGHPRGKPYTCAEGFMRVFPCLF